MRILQIASGDFFSNYGGGQVYVKNIVDELILQGEDISIVSSVDNIVSIIRKEYKGRDLYEIPSLSDGQFAQIVSEIHPDVIHAHSLKAQACRVGTELGIPVVVTAHHGGIVCPAGALMDSRDCICDKKACHSNCLPCCLRNIRSGRYWYPLMRILPEKAYIALGKGLNKIPFIPFISPIGKEGLHINSKLHEWLEIARKCTVMVAPSQALADAMERNGLESSKISVIPHGIPLPTCDAWCRNNSGTIKFFYVGRISYIKGVHVMLEAFSKLPESIDAELHIIGGAVRNDEVRYLKKLQRGYGNNKCVVWHGKVDSDKIFGLIKGFDISVVPTICLEAFGLNVSESLAMGKPVLATRCGGAEMQVSDGVNGWLVKPNDVKSLAETMAVAAKTYSNVNPKTCIDSVKSIKIHTENLLNLYKSIANM